MIVVTQMYGCKCSFEKQYALNRNIYQIQCIHAIYGCNCSSKKYRIYWGMVGCNYFSEIKKHCTLKKNCSPRLITVTYKEKMFFRNNYSTLDHSLFNLGSYLNKIFVHLFIIAAVFYFSLYKFIWRDPAKNYLFKVNSRNTKEKSEICPKLTINTVESSSGVLIIDFEDISHFF